MSRYAGKAPFKVEQSHDPFCRISDRKFQRLSTRLHMTTARQIRKIIGADEP